ncbi:nucleoside-diphosphate-sugar epimerase [Ureibacillus xyleni]|uniref:Nucleoside-diphosphate-sugar epimerase n=1 Tax=Ureibacillus xyleni TaxID=614648 RepID=A0A285SF20_9BACL|nr:NAD-dependent epimerase/dehydratase family protein [Ureibacillus xyleni]SOC06522.1 nucleoside-diphosphate-sugar epimerase [Ureibacillus xyleni]
MQDILVLGGTQYFGKQLVERLLADGKNVNIATRGLTADSFGDRVNRLKLDREDEKTVFAAFKEGQWDVVYDQTCYSPKELKATTEALKGKVKKYILTSSQAVYDYGTNHKEEAFDPTTFTFSFKGRKEYPGFIGYQEAKRASEAVLFNDQSFEAVSVRFPIVVGKDDFTERVKFHVEKVMNEEEIGAKNFDVRLGFISSDEAADFLYKMGESNFTGAINPGSRGDLSLRELIQKIESHVNKRAILTSEVTSENASPFAFDGSWSVNTEKAEQLGFHFTGLHDLLDKLIEFYSINGETKS